MKKSAVDNLIDMCESADRWPYPDACYLARLEIEDYRSALSTVKTENAHLREAFISLWRMMKTKEFPVEAGTLIMKIASSLLVKP